METYTIGHAASLLGVSPNTARRWADAGRFGFWP
jgi:excisionase family DNA binding protein